jgi:CRISPR-associated exonuclease Cas4
VSEFADKPGRLRALTDLDSTLLVEAAAGTGKTALMAGRVTMLLASGVNPSSVAAITFTELAPSELSSRVHRYVDDLLNSMVPEPLRVALPSGLGPSHRELLLQARQKLNTLTACTIHGFCQAIIRQYAVEASLDPGTEVIDADAAEAAFDGVFDRWFRARLGPSASASDPIVNLSRDQPQQVVSTLLELARFRRDHRTARPLAADVSGRPDLILVQTVDEFRRWAARNPIERGTAETVAELEILAGFYSSCFDHAPSFEELWHLARPPRLRIMRRDTYDLVEPRRKTAWKNIAGKENGEVLNAEAEGHFRAANAAYRTLLGTVATAVVATLTDELDEVLEAYAEFKRRAAVVDFDDLLYHAQQIVRHHEAVRQALGQRYRHILVDEFQDTDPIQAEILFRIASDDRPESWPDGTLRPGSLFLVGDPKQAIYQFRGANAGSYGQAKRVIENRHPAHVIHITANFRSQPRVLDYVNGQFAVPLNAAGQPGYVPLTATVEQSSDGLPSVTKLVLSLPPDAKANHIRAVEAEAVAEACARLVGNLKVRNDEGELVPLAPGGIALLAPTGTDLWHYESALEERGLPIASQAGKGLFRRQEIQDLVALTRVLADGRDRLAFGALMRGPLVGLSEEELLDIALALSANSHALEEETVHFSVLSDPDQVSHAVAREVLTILHDLRKHARATTPALLLTEAIEQLNVRPALGMREQDRSARAAANVEAFLTRARAYAVKGLTRFARDISRDWKAGADATKGRVDSDGDAIEIVTMHSSKGLEWPVVVPINTATQLRSRNQFVHRPADDTFHWLLGDVVPPGLKVALDADAANAQRERERLWYVACTRARDLLVIPDIRAAGVRSWAKVLALGLEAVPALNLTTFPSTRPVAAVDSPNTQTRELFDQQNKLIQTLAKPTRWVRPSEGDADRRQVLNLVSPPEMHDGPELEVPPGAGRLRGLLLHKLLEEILTGELGNQSTSVIERVHGLLAELIGTTGLSESPDPTELAATVTRTLALPEILQLRPRLVPEFAVQCFLAPTSAISGRADAIEIFDGRPRTVVDWKSDRVPSVAVVGEHAEQLALYSQALGAERALLVYMTSGTVHQIAVKTAN